MEKLCFLVLTFYAIYVLFNVSIRAEEPITMRANNMERFRRLSLKQCLIFDSSLHKTYGVEDGIEVQKKPTAASPKRASCFPKKGLNISDLEAAGEENRVEMINATELISLLTNQFESNVTKRSMPAICTLVMFYAPWCPFSARAAPFFNGLARLFPDVVFAATDANRNPGLTTQFGILAFPTVLLFHNSKPVVKFNHSADALENMVAFMMLFTGLEPVGEIVVKDEDKVGPMPTVCVPETDYNLYLSWVFIFCVAIGYFGKTPFCQRIIESLRNNWQEVEIQHEHGD